MIVSNKLEEVLIAVPNENYDRALAALANSGIIHVEEPPGPLKDYINRAYRKVALEAAEKRSKLEGIMKTIGVDLRPAGVVEVRVRDWEEAFHEVVKANSDLEGMAEKAASRITELSARASELQAVVSALSPVSDISADVRAANEGLHVRGAVGVISSSLLPTAYQIASKHGLLYVARVADEEAVLAVAGEAQALSLAISELSRIGWKQVTVPPDMPGSPREAFEAANQLLRKVTEEIEEVRADALKMSEGLRKYYAEVSALAEALRAVSLSARTATTSFIYGFVDAKDSRRLREVLEGCCGKAYVIRSLGIRRGEKFVPTKVDLPGYFRWFQSIVEMYGTPSSDEIVPTVFMAVTMPVIFGLMFPDIGHGLLVLLFALLYMLPRSRDIAKVAAVLGAAGMITGFLAGEFFGPIPAQALGLDRLWRSLGFSVPPLLSPVEAATHEDTQAYTMALFNEVLNISFWIGAFMLTFGNVLGIADDVLGKDYEDLFAKRLPLTLLFLAAGLPFLAYFNAYRAGYTIERALFGLGSGGPMEAFVFYGAIVAIAWLLVGDSVYSLVSGEGFRFDPYEGFLGMFEGMLLTLGNTISFLRIMGLSLAHAGLMVGFTVLTFVVLTSHPTALTYAAAAVIYIIGNLLTAGLEGIVAFAHDLRLHFYEWFNKFYRGLGKPFTPLVVPGVVFVVS
ncbi:MAG: V-type ATP synthase subunit I [Acidilobus sp.]